MLHSNPHIRPKALSKTGQRDRDTDRIVARAVLAQALNRYVGRGRRFRTSDVADQIGCHESLIKQTVNVDSGLPAKGEVRLLMMIGALGPDFANTLLRPFGLTVSAAPEAIRVHPLEVAEVCGSQGVMIVQHCQDYVLDIRELTDQEAMLRQILTLIKGYHSSVVESLAAGQAVNLRDWRR